MTNQVATTEKKPSVTAGNKIAGLVPRDIDEAFRMSQALARSGDMIPQHFQGKPDMIMAAVMRGAEVGLAPMQALSNIAVINGRATIWGDALPAMLQRHGHALDHEIVGEGKEAKAVATLVRGDTGQKFVREFSMADAEKAGLLAKKGPWQNYPTRMLAMRARSWAARDGAADALMGLQVREEVDDYQPIKDVTPREDTSGFGQLAKRARSRVDQETQDDRSAEGDVLTGEAQDSAPEFTPDPESEAYKLGVEAAKEGFVTRDQCPVAEYPDQHQQWLAGFDSVEASDA